MAKVIYSEEKLFYDTYVWEKTSYVTFIWRIAKCNVPKERAILPWRLPITRETIKNRWKKHRENDPVWQFYDKYLWDKPSYRYYKEKVNSWMPLHEAIKKNVKRAKYLKENNIVVKKKPKTVIVSNSDDNFFIKITYSKEEAKVFREVYIDRIDELEDMMLSCEPEEMGKLLETEKQLKKELDVFNKWNPL